MVVLLGLLTAHARLLGRVLDAPPDGHDVVGGLMHQPVTARWIDFVAHLEPRQAGGRWRNGIVGRIPAADVAHWQQPHAGILPASQLVRLPDLRAFHTWAPRIRCFSFVLSPLAATSPRAAAAESQRHDATIRAPRR